MSRTTQLCDHCYVQCLFSGIVHTHTHTNSHMCSHLFIWLESSAWWNSKAERPIRSSGLYPTNSVTLETGRLKKSNRRIKNSRDFFSHLAFLSLWFPPLKAEPLFSLRSKVSQFILPALAVCEAQVHAVAGEKGAGVQRELHAGRVRDGLTQQGHHSGCRGRRGAAGKWAHVTCAVENLQKQEHNSF